MVIKDAAHASTVNTLISATMSIPASIDPQRAGLLTKRNNSLVKQTNAPGALVIEDPPNDPNLRTRLNFQSYPDTIEQVYNLVDYREIGATRMSQPGFVAYRGGNWGAFPLELQFRAGLMGKDNGGPAFTVNLTPFASADDINFDTPAMQQILIDNESLVWWCLALGFPLARALGATAQGQLGVSGQTGKSGDSSGPSLADVTGSVNNLQRYDPPIILIQFGSWLTIRGYVKSVGIKWERPFHPKTGRAYGATVTFSFQPLMTFYPNFQSIANQSGDQDYVARTNRLRAAAQQQNAANINAKNNLASGG